MTTGSVGRRSGVFLLSRIVGSAGFFAAVVVLAHGLEPSGRGAIAFLTVTALTVNAVVRLGVGDATLVLLARHPASRGVLFSNLLVWTLMTATVGGSVAAFGLFIAGDHRPAGIGLGEIVAVAFGTVLSAFVDAGYAMLLASGRVREQATLTATGPWLYAALLIAISLTSGLTIRSAALAWVVSQGVAAVGLLIISLRGTALGPPSGALLRESIAFGIQVWVGSLSSLLNARLDQLLVGVLASTRSLGAYAVAVNAAEIVFYVPTAFALALLSTIARDAPDLRALRVTLAFRAALLVTAALSIVGALLGPLVVPLVFGAQYGESVLPYVLLLPGGLGFTATGILSPALLLWSSPRLASVGPGIALVVGVVLDFQLIPVHGVAGAALAATTALLAGGAAALISYHVRTRAPWKSFVPGPADLRLLGSSAGSLLRSLLRVAR